MWLERSDKRDDPQQQLSLHQPARLRSLHRAGGHLTSLDSDRAIIRGNESQLGGLGIVLVRSHNNLLQGNKSAGRGS